MNFTKVFSRPIHAGLATVAVAATLISSCGHGAPRVHAPIAPARIGSTETGVASWYGIPYHGRASASGEIYDMQQLTAAHRRLPFQTWIEVTNLANGKQVAVRINDRGPFVKGRILDLSQAAARQLDMLRPGSTRVRLKVIPPPFPSPAVANAKPAPAPERVIDARSPNRSAPFADPPAAPLAPPPASPLAAPSARTLYAVQAGAFSRRESADSLRALLEDEFAEARVVPSGGTPALWRVIVGREMTHEQAAELALRVRQKTKAALVVPEPEPNSAPDSDASGVNSAPK